MGLALVRSRALLGLEAAAVTVEVHLANGLPSFTLVGLADVEVKEARERVRSALLNAGLNFPHNQRITVNLAPADLPKDSGRFDLPIALGILAASGQIEAGRLAAFEWAGELSLSGELRAVRGALAMSLALQRAGTQTAWVLPPGSAEEAALVPGAQVYRAVHLLDVVRALQAPDTPQAIDDPNAPLAPSPSGAVGTAHAGWQRLRTQPPQPQPSGPDLSDVRGQVGARRALEIAAAGGHSVLMVGPPGAGKSMLAQRFAGLLPALSAEQALETAALASLAERFDWTRDWGVRPTRAPHHTASAVALVGGGSPPRPGEISLAHHGVLFLDELPEFSRAALEALREPLETGHITISRAAHSATFPARFQLIAAMNPCPCGHLGDPQKACRCTPDQVARYRARLSGPLLDRIDLHVEVAALPAPDLLAVAGRDALAECSAAVRQRVQAAHTRALARQGVANAQLVGEDLLERCALEAPVRAFVQQAAARLGWSARGTHRALRVARTLADLAGAQRVQLAHVAESVQYRQRSAA